MAIRQESTHTWTKSSYSNAQSACVEVRTPSASSLAVRDSKTPEGAALAFPAGVWNAFVESVK
ncbi:DUF397 domain-containing protein [Streptomyces roseirectus]|uniref:DUF397 domain-containing protein n=1 Tax=Streptomyces roseirectus TaxID=2768066 RepID=A0A7H0IH38_9ACTN|nr:DUF397 domain-containing protein [Streptomyces roseirectus]QNP72104.1 DUF397 domain-containing protein [Streptomyces roseirectus]